MADARAGRAHGLHASGEEPRGDRRPPISTTGCAPSRSTPMRSWPRSSTPPAAPSDLNLIVRLGGRGRRARPIRWPASSASTPHEAPALLLAARRATQELMGVAFHVGSQCMRPDRLPGGHGPGLPRPGPRRRVRRRGGRRRRLPVGLSGHGPAGPWPTTSTPSTAASPR